jgi:hypothetical protein
VEPLGNAEEPLPVGYERFWKDEDDGLVNGADPLDDGGFVYDGMLLAPL